MGVADVRSDAGACRGCGCVGCGGGADAGMTTAEYAMGTDRGVRVRRGALKVRDQRQVQAALQGIVERALHASSEAGPRRRRAGERRAGDRGFVTAEAAVVLPVLVLSRWRWSGR